MKSIIFLAIAFYMTGCSSAISKKTDGRAWVPLSCSGILQWDTCFNEAKALCPKGFDIANQVELRPSQTRRMEVACKD